MIRKVEIQRPEPDELVAFTALVGQGELNDAIGYLSLWALDAYPLVTISFRDCSRDQPELIAVYRDAAGDRKYVIGAVFNPDSKKFGFHS